MAIVITDKFSPSRNLSLQADQARFYVAPSDLVISRWLKHPEIYYTIADDGLAAHLENKFPSLSLFQRQPVVHRIVDPGDVVILVEQFGEPIPDSGEVSKNTDVIFTVVYIS